MKKAMLKILVMTAALAFAAGTAWGADANEAWQSGEGVTIADTGGGGQIKVTLSPNVYVFYQDDDSTGKGTTYAAASYNEKGTKQYGVASDFQGIKYKNIYANNTLTAIDPSAPSAAAFSGWVDVGR